MESAMKGGVRLIASQYLMSELSFVGALLVPHPNSNLNRNLTLFLALTLILALIDRGSDCS